MEGNTIMRLSEVVSQLEKLKKEGKKIVTTNGCFDILHRGHAYYLKEAKKLGDILVVGINSDESVRGLKGVDRPLNKASDRAFLVSQLKSVDFVFVFEESLPNEFLKKINPHIHVKGGDYQVETLPEYSLLQSMGARVVTIPFVEGYSTTSTLEKMKK
jgi:rfaE bifunctional protein nucleotidyltransferase chain/domain